MMLFYHKLDILNRIFVLNYLDQELLERQSLIRNINFEHAELQQNASPYFNLSDIKLILASLSTIKISKLFRHILLYIISQDKSIALDGSILTKLHNYFSTKELDYLFDCFQKNKINRDIRPILAKFQIDDIISHLKHIYFFELKKHLSLQIGRKFILNQSKNTELLAALAVFDLDAIVKEQLGNILKSTNQVIQSFLGHKSLLGEA